MQWQYNAKNNIVSISAEMLFLWTLFLKVKPEVILLLHAYTLNQLNSYMIEKEKNVELLVEINDYIYFRLLVYTTDKVIRAMETLNYGVIS